MMVEVGVAEVDGDDVVDCKDERRKWLLSAREELRERNGRES